MAVEVSWANTHRSIVRVAYLEKWSIEEVRAARKDAYHCIASVAHPVHIIFDFTQTQHMPRQMSSGIQSSVGYGLPQNASGLVIIVGASNLMRSSGETPQQRRKGPSGDNVRYAETLEDAMALINQQKQQNA